MSVRAAPLVLLLLFGFAAVEAAPVGVRLPEGNMRGFLIVRAADGEAIGHGEWRQKPAPGLIESRFTLVFKDGSRREESVTYSQDKAFRLERYRLVQRGPSFPTAEITFDRRSARYTARTAEKKGGEEVASEGQMEMPHDLYNGMELVLLKNLAEGASATGQMVVFFPKPRLIKMTLSAEAEEKVRLGNQVLPVRRYLVKLEKAIDKSTVQFTLTKPASIFMSVVPEVHVVNSARLKKHEKDGDWGAGWLTSNDAGSGSYMLTRYDPAIGFVGA